jgi:hypothetical protein
MKGNTLRIIRYNYYHVDYEIVIPYNYTESFYGNRITFITFPSQIHYFELLDSGQYYFRIYKDRIMV